MNFAVYEHLVGQSRALGVKSDERLIKIALGEYWDKFSGRVNEGWERLPSICLQLKPKPAIGGKAFGSGEKSFDLATAGAGDTEYNAACNFPDGLTKTFGQAHLVLMKYSARRALPEVSVVPISMLVGMDKIEGYTVYAHSFLRDDKIQTYIGITRHSWASRWAQHLSASRAGSRYRFHEAIRRDDGSAYTTHRVYASGLTFEDAMNLEEKLVDQISLYPRGLNMIPGGFAGIRYLGKYGFRPSSKMLENRHALVRAVSEYCGRKGKPNPLQAAFWRDDDHATSVICNNPRNFDLPSVRDIRFQGEVGRTPVAIAAQYKTSEVRIGRLLSGHTYSRVS